MSIKIFNTLTHKKEELITLEPSQVKMYVCGPTVYSKAHVGHAMSVMVFDILRRYMEYRGFVVTHLMNFTDVDDKIIIRANEQKRDPFELAQSYIDEFKQHLADLNILPASFNPRATHEIDQILKMIQGLIDKGYAYPVDGDVYFRVQKDYDYGKLSGRKIEDMQAGARISVDDRKEHPMDFALWKSARPGEPAWDSPWGKGRPGWHIECSAMNMHHLGEQIDIHGGGNDLIFPHHENEIAQTESLTGKPFATYWVHNGMLQCTSKTGELEKMSKSTGNLVTIEEFLASHGADTLRMMVLNSGYRNPLTFNDDVIAQAEKAVERLHSGLKPADVGAKGGSKTNLEELHEQIENTQKDFIAAMDDDFNSAGALGVLFDFVRVINQARAAGATNEELSRAQAVLRELVGVLGLRLSNDKNDLGLEAAPFIDLLLELRGELRVQKNFALTDKIRDKLSELGVLIEDGKQGTSWRWK